MVKGLVVEGIIRFPHVDLLLWFGDACHAVDHVILKRQSCFACKHQVRYLELAELHADTATEHIIVPEPGVFDDKGRCFYFTPTGIFAITKPINGEPASHGNGCTIGFAAENPAAADAWHAAGLANGGSTCEEPPGVREGAAGKLYLAYLLDPSGNKICALHRVE